VLSVVLNDAFHEAGFGDPLPMDLGAADGSERPRPSAASTSRMRTMAPSTDPV
jgi:hypothetical protein